MATYLPNVKDYVPEVKAYTPDFKFLSDSLDERQDRYNKSTKQLNNLYGQVVYADLSREDNQSVRDDYAKVLAPKIQQISGLDFSLAQNVQAAQGLFKPFYEDEKIVRDIVYTKTFKDQMGVANDLKNASTADQRKRYWDDGVQYMNFMLEDFKNKSRDESMKVPLPEYFENPDLFARALKALETGGPDGKGIKTTDMFVDQTGQFIVTMENGTQLTNKPTGRMVPNKEFNPDLAISASNPETIPEMYNPAANRIKETVLEDPLIQQGLRVKGYVDARKFYQQQAENSGLPVEQFKREWALNQINKYKNESTELITKEREQLNIVNQELVSWEEYSKDLPLITGSDEYVKWFEAMTKGETISKGISQTEKRQKDILANMNEEDLESLMNRGYSAYISNSITEDIFSAARQYRDETSKRTFTESKQYIEKLRHANNRELAREKRLYDLLLKQDEERNNINDQSRVPIAIDGDIRENANSYGSLSEANESAELSELNTQMQNKIATIVSFYSTMADDLNTDANLQNMADLTITDQNRSTGNVSTAGIYIPVIEKDNEDNVISEKLKFYRWEEAQTILKDRPKILNHYFNNVQNIHNNQNQAASYKSTDNIELRSTISELLNNNERINTKLDIVKANQNRVYTNVLDGLIDDGSIPKNYGNILKNYPLFNNKAEINASELLNEQLNSDFINWFGSTFEGGSPSLPFYRNQVGAEITESLKPIAERFGFRNTNHLLDAIYPWNVTYGDNRLVTKDQERNRTSIMFASDRHFSNLNDELVGKDGIKDMYAQIRERLDEAMASETAIPGETTFDFNSAFNGNGTIGDKSISKVIPYRFDAGTKDKYVNAALDNFFTGYDNLRSMPGMVYAVLGDRGSDFESVLEEDQTIANMIINQVRADRSYIPGNTSKGTDPGYRMEISETGGGESANGQYAMIKFILDTDYKTNIEKTMPRDGERAFKIPNNTVTIFLNKELFSNPTDSDMQVTSTLKTEILDEVNQGRKTLSLDNGGVVHFEMFNGVVTQKYAEYVFNTTGPNAGNMTLNGYTSRPLVTTNGNPILDTNLDRYYDEMNKELQRIATINLQAQKNYKLQQTPVETTEE
tara:strand:+ start:10660 stop:13944 length:3285 start_codon:yes stop_codon:yes gene_type:complete